MKYLLTSVLALTLMGGLPAVAAAQLDTMVAESVSALSGDFTKKRYTVHGGWEITEQDGESVIKFTDDFKTKNGPDLKVFLSPKTISDVTGKTAISGAVNIGVLKSNKGAQTYTLPQGVSLSDYKSVLIQCESYAVLWGGFDIPE